MSVGLDFALGVFYLYPCIFRAQDKRCSWPPYILVPQSAQRTRRSTTIPSWERPRSRSVWTRPLAAVPQGLKRIIILRPPSRSYTPNRTWTLEKLPDAHGCATR